MQLNSDLLNGIALATNKLELALAHAKLDSSLTITSVNSSFSQVANSYDLSLTHLFSWLKNKQYPTVAELLTALKKLKSLTGETQNHSNTGQPFHIQWSMSLTSDSQLVCFIRDIRWRQKYKDQWTLFERIFNSGRSSIVVTDEANRIVLVNKHFEDTSGYSKNDVLGLDPGCFSSGRQTKVFYQELWRTLHRDGYWSGTIWNKRKDGREYPEQKTIYAVTNEQGVLTNYFSSGEILPYTNEKAIHQSLGSDKLISQQALLNTLNNNRHQYLDPVAIFHIGLDNLDRAKQVCGLSFGDHIVRVLLKRLSDTFLPNGLICCSAGDEFIVATPNINTPEIANNIGRALLSSLNSTISHGDIQWKITASIGTSFFVVDNDAWKAIEQAHIAMHHAKGKGGNSLQFYDINTHVNAKEGLLLEQALKSAITNQELSLHYQPLLDLNSNKVFSAEALLRWNSKVFGHVRPDRFIPMAEQSDLILDIGLWVFKMACQQMSTWGDEFLGTVAINLSAQQIQCSDLPRKLLDIAKEHGILVNRINLEITETAMINDTNSAISVIAALKEAGFSISMDDFGTGYSSLNYLTRFQVDKLKVDRSFIDTMTTSNESLIVTKAIVGLAKSLGLRVVAEGVETEAQLNELSFLNCDYAQGYLLSRPLPADQFLQYYQNKNASQSAQEQHSLLEKYAS